MVDEKRVVIGRTFTKDKPAYDQFSWGRNDVTITDDNGLPLYTQKEIEFPETWGNLPRTIVASKYFWGENGTPQRENSVKQLVDRVTGKIASWGVEQGYMDSDEATNLREELRFLAVNQMMAFNSPVWFNVGVDTYAKNGSKKNDKKTAFVYDRATNSIINLPRGEEYVRPQTSACFIQSVDDTMEGIMQLAYNEAMLFKFGSGTGTDLSTLRSSREKLSGGGVPSGPLAYLLFYDKVAGIVKSGGKTRRAAKMDTLRVEHPDIMEFIEAKRKEQIKLEILMDNLIGAGIAKDKAEAYRIAESTVGYQNANLSVRASDAFMRAVEADKDWQTIPVHNKDMLAEMPRYKAKDMSRAIAEGTRVCGDPGMQFSDTISKWHTCPNSAPINSSNPCSEYMFVDDSSCNLASLNLRKFLNPEGQFNIASFLRTIELTAVSQDLLYDASSFPTAKVAENSHRFRPLGMGYANLGSFMMALGLPYDSDEARATAAAITALQTGKVYETSTRLAEKVGPFEEFEKNRDPMLKVIGMHRDALKNIDRTKLPPGLEGVLDEAERTWATVEERGRLYGFRNAQATVLAPTGTIGFMMGCDTTGIEPETWLVKEKNLSDGGKLAIINGTVPIALKKLGYDPTQVEAITSYLKERRTIEGAPGLKDEHLPIFDCAYKAQNGKRAIHYMGHLKMMAAVQPFLSGAISKTVSLDYAVTTEEVERVYMAAWKMGLKSVALYRDGSKRMQPLTSGKSDLETKATNGSSNVPARRKLPTTRPAVTHKFALGGDLQGNGAHEGYLTLGFHPEDGALGEMFLTMSKEGSLVSGMVDAVGTLASLCYQYGVPARKLADKFKGMKFEPKGFVSEGRDDMKTTESIIEYVFEATARFAEEQQKRVAMGTNPSLVKLNGDKNSTAESSEEREEPGGFCLECGKQMKKKGHCLEVCSCGWINPKGCGQ